MNFAEACKLLELRVYRPRWCRGAGCRCSRFTICCVGTRFRMQELKFEDLRTVHLGFRAYIGVQGSGFGLRRLRLCEFVFAV